MSRRVDLHSDEEDLGSLLRSHRRQGPVPGRFRRLLVGLTCILVAAGVAWRISIAQNRVVSLGTSSSVDIEEKVGLAFFGRAWCTLTSWWHSCEKDEVIPGTKYEEVTVEAVAPHHASERHYRRQKLMMEQDLAALFHSHIVTKGKTYTAPRKDTEEECSSQADTLFHHVVWAIGVGDELDHRELAAYKERFAKAMTAGCKGSKSQDSWIDLAGKELESQKPVMTVALASSLNSAKLGFKLQMQDWLLEESAATFKKRLGLLPIPEGQKDVLNRKSRQVASVPKTFRAEEKWPQCRNEILRIHNQGHCGSCWAFGGLASVDARMCIASNGTWNAPADILSRLQVTSCAPSLYIEGHDGCQGGWPHWPMEFMAKRGVVSSACLPYYISGEGSQHFQTQDAAPPCPTHCQMGYNMNMDGDSFSSEGVQHYDWLANVHGNADKILAMKSAIYTEGPISFAFFANGPFMGYAGGVFGVCTGSDRANHAVYAFGWGTLPTSAGGGEVEFVEASNSWGPDWGVNGHFRIHPRCITDVFISGTIEKKVIGHSVGEVDSSVPADPDNEYWPWAKPIECPLVDGGCVTDVEMEADYKNNEVCVSKVLNGKKIKVVEFETELGYDVLTVNGHLFSGKLGVNADLANLSNLIVDANGIRFQSDASEPSRGFKICAA